MLWKKKWTKYDERWVRKDEKEREKESRAQRWCICICTCMCRGKVMVNEQVRLSLAVNRNEFTENHQRSTRINIHIHTRTDHFLERRMKRNVCMNTSAKRKLRACAGTFLFSWLLFCYDCWLLFVRKLLHPKSSSTLTHTHTHKRIPFYSNFCFCCFFSFLHAIVICGYS